MPTASVYYHTSGDHKGEPHFVLIDGEQAYVNPNAGSQGDSIMGGDWRLRAVNDACRALRYRTRPGAKIVRQADGRGTVVIEPIDDQTAPDETPLRHGVAAITQEEADSGTAWVIQVAIDGQVQAEAARGYLGSLDPLEHGAAAFAVDNVLAAMTYVRSGPLTPDVGETWACTADPIGDPAAKAGGPPVPLEREVEALLNTDLDDVPLRLVVRGKLGKITTSDPLLSGGLNDVDRALYGIGYRRTTDPEIDMTGSHGRVWTMKVVEVDWRDHPTLLRLSDTVAEVLHKMSATLGIPADTLAAAWLMQASSLARLSYERFMEPGYIADHDRITGWAPEGYPYLKG